MIGNLILFALFGGIAFPMFLIAAVGLWTFLFDVLRGQD